MSLLWKIKRFDELSTTELYNLLQLRSEVFVVEQNCVYLDIDGKDAKAIHLLGEKEGKVLAYARIFYPGDYFEEASIGRVVVKSDIRKQAAGHELMREAIGVVETQMNGTTITISAQLYLQRFYETHGFVIEGEPYLEDDIPHIRMKRI